MLLLNLSTTFCGGRLQPGLLAGMCLLTLGGLGVGAQGQAKPVVAEAVRQGSCPSVVTARYVPGAALRLVNPGKAGEARKPLYMSFGAVGQGEGERITQALVTVRGMTEKGGVIPAGAVAASPMLERTFSVNVGANPAGLQSGTVWLTGFGGVGDVRVDSITYGSGRVWKAAADGGCHAHMGVVNTQAE